MAQSLTNLLAILLPDNLIRQIDAIRPLLTPFNSWELTALLVNLVLFLSIPLLLRMMTPHNRRGETHRRRRTALRAINLAMIIAILLRNFYFESGPEDAGGIEKFLSICAVIYAAFLATQFALFYLLKRFGKRVPEETGYSYRETYRSRMLSLLLITGMVSLVLTLIVQIIGRENWLTGGVIAFVGIVAALTQGSWAPDLVSGLIILNSGLVDDGDIIRIDSELPLVRVYKTRLFHTEMLNLVDNHRIMLSNARLRQMDIHNLSKFASARGLREKLCFKIGYNVSPATVRQALGKAFEHAAATDPGSIEGQYGVVINILDTGDDAIEWGMYFYTKAIERLPATRQLIREAVLLAAMEHQFELATPALMEIPLAEAIRVVNAASE